MNEHDTTELNKDPFVQFNEWYSLKRKSAKENYNAMILSSSTAKGRVSSRVVLLKEHSNNGFIFYSNYLSKKGRQLSLNPAASLLFYWPEFKRQIRIEGTVGKTTSEESDLYFESRIQDHKLNAIVSRQSDELKSKEELIEQYNKLNSSPLANNPQRPDHWGAYRLVPDLFEFWQEGENRFHDRIEYRLVEQKWQLRRLYP